MSCSDNRVLKKFMQTHASSYQLNRKRVIVTYDKSTYKIPYENFFKASVTKTDNNWSFECFSKKEDSIDMSLFAIIGIVSMVSRWGVFEDGCERGGDIKKHLDALLEYVMDKYPIVNNLEEFSSSEEHILEILLFNRSSISSLSKKVENYPLKSLYMCSNLSMSEFRPNIGIIPNIYGYLLILSQREDFSTILTDIFLRFAPMIYLSGLFSYPSILDSITDSLSLFSEIDCLNKFPYRKYKVNDGSLEVTDVEGFSALFVTQMVASLFTGCFNSDGLGDFSFDFSCYTNVIGTDGIADYLITGSPMKFIKSIIKPKICEIVVRNISYSFPSNNLWGMCEFFKDIEVIGADIECFTSSSALTKDLFNLLHIRSLLLLALKRGDTDLINMALESINYERAYYTKETNYYKERNEELGKNNRRLGRQVKSLQDEINKLKESYSSGSIDNSLKFSLESKDGLIAILKSQIEELNSKVSQQEEALNDLLVSLNTDDTEVSTNVPLDEVIKFLNGFSLLIVGGRIDLETKLTELGLKNFTHIDSLSDVQRIGNFDFVVSMTRFLSHKVYYGVLNKIGSENKDKHTYYNGTNLETLLYSCYDFINKYFDM